MSGERDGGPCDHCGEVMGARGWMKPTGETMRLSDDGADLPVYRFYCSEECCRAALTRVIPFDTCPTCDGRGVWMDEPCDECSISPTSDAPDRRPGMSEHRWADVRGWGGAFAGTLQCDLCNRVASPTDPKHEELLTSECKGVQQ